MPEAQMMPATAVTKIAPRIAACAAAPVLHSRVPYPSTSSTLVWRPAPQRQQVTQTAITQTDGVVRLRGVL